MTPNADPRPRVSGSHAPAGVKWLSPPALRLHAVMIVGVAGSAAAAWFEWTRALSGHALAWAYSFEWPLFALMGIYLWWRLLHQDHAEGAAARASRRHRFRRSVTEPRVAPDDPQLVAWEAYLTRLQALDPPGGPPRREPA